MLWLAACAVALSLPALRLGLQNDDYLLALNVARGAPAWDLFDFRELGARAARESGFTPWWASPNSSQRFLRPLASLLHTLEFTFWPGTPWLMLLTNALIYGACVALAAALYRRLSPSPASAGVAALLFAVDQAHATSVGWISGRNTLLAMTFALAALLAHIHGRAPARRPWRWASSAAVACALLSAEAGVWSLALLAAYALVLEPGGRFARLSTIAPQLALGAAWATAYLLGGFGMHGASSYYRDTSAPLLSLARGVLDLPLWSASLFGPEGVALSLFLPEHWARLAALPVALFTLWLVLPELQTSRPCRMFALASALCVAPLLFTLPNARVLLGPNFGALGWIGCVVEGASGNGARRWQRRLLLWMHLALGLAFPLSLASIQALERGTQALAGAVAPARDVVVLRSPMELFGSFTLAALAQRGRPAPRTLHQLYAGGSELSIERKEPRAIEVVAQRGWGFAPLERLACSADAMPRTGRVIRARAVTATVLESTADGRPRRVRFSFPTPLESPERQWLVWQPGGPVPWHPPRVGARARLAPLPFHRALPL